MIKEDNYVSLDIAMLLAEKGYDGICEDKFPVEIKDSEGEYFGEDQQLDGIATSFVAYSKPTLEEAARWLREKHKIAVCLFPYCYRWNYNIYDFTTVDNDCTHKVLGARVDLKTYEQALSEGIKEALKMI